MELSPFMLLYSNVRACAAYAMTVNVPDGEGEARLVHCVCMYVCVYVCMIMCHVTVLECKSVSCIRDDR